MVADWIEWAKGAEIIAGLIGTLVALIWGAIRWADVRARRRAEEIKDDISHAHADDRSRLGAVESRVLTLETRVGQVEQRVEEGFRSIGEEIEGVRRILGGVASKDDIGELRVAQARIDARLDGMVENDRQLLRIVQNQGEQLSEGVKMMMTGGRA